MIELTEKWKKCAERFYADTAGLDVNLLTNEEKKQAYEELKTYDIFLSEEKLKETFNY